MRRVLVLVCAAAALAVGALAVEASVGPAPAQALTVYAGGPMCAWPLNWSERHWSQAYGVWFQYIYTGGGLRVYAIWDYWGNRLDNWGRPVGCGA